MMLHDYISFEENQSQNQETKIVDPPRRINRKFFTEDVQSISLNNDAPVVNLQEKKKKGRPSKSTKKIDGDNVVLADQSSDRELSVFESRASYSDTYEDTNNLLKTTLQQMDTLQGELTMDLEQIRASRTLKRKYDYLSAIGGTISTLLNSKIGAIRELNKSITDAHNLDFKKFKELKVNESDKDDNKSIMEMYKAFISTPVGTYNAPAMPSPVDITSIGMNSVVRADIVDNADQYVQQFNTVTPEQNMMLLEDNPDVSTVVKLDDVTGQMMYDVINMQTGESVPNTTKPDPMFLDNLILDRYNKVARDRNLNRVYPLIIMNENRALNEY